MKKLNVIIPFFSVNSDITTIDRIFYDMYSDTMYLSLFKDDVQLAGVCGNFWNAKMARRSYIRNLTDEREPLSNIRDFKKWIESSHLKVFLDLSNVYFDDKMTYAYYDNCILEVFQGSHSHAIVGTDLAHDYIKNNFTYQLVEGSVCKYTYGDKPHFKDIAYREVTDLANVKKPENTIIVINDYCDGCENELKHIYQQSKQNRDYKPPRDFNNKYEYRGIFPHMCCNKSAQLAAPIKTQLEFLREDLCDIAYAKIANYPFYTVSDYVNLLTSIFVKEPFREVARNLIMHVYEERMMN